MKNMTVREWKQLDGLYEQRTRDTLAWCVGVHAHEDSQVEIAERYGIGTAAVCCMNSVGANQQKFFTSGKVLIDGLPSGWRSLYELCDLTKTQIKSLCAKGRPTRAMIESTKRNLGLLGPLPSKTVKKSTSKGLKYVAKIVPAKDLDGLSEFGARSLEKEQDDIGELLDEVDSKLKPKIAKLQVKILNVYNRQMEAEIRSRVKIAVAEKQAKLDRELKRVIEREKKTIVGIPPAARKLIQSVLHPDKAPPGQEERYAKAFDAFRKYM